MTPESLTRGFIGPVRRPLQTSSRVDQTQDPARASRERFIDPILTPSTGTYYPSFMWRGSEL
jgi:hypothetical protein